MIKMRVISKLKHVQYANKLSIKLYSQIIYKHNSMIILSILYSPQLQCNHSHLIIFQKDSKDVFFTDSQFIKNKIESLKNFKCPFTDCQYDQYINNFNLLKLHLKVEHQPFYCDVCDEQKTCFLTEQQLYTEYQVRHHINYGDIDEDSNIIFKHPYCKFCKNIFTMKTSLNSIQILFILIVVYVKIKNSLFIKIIEVRKNILNYHIIYVKQQNINKFWLFLKHLENQIYRNNKVIVMIQEQKKYLIQIFNNLQDFKKIQNKKNNSMIKKEKILQINSFHLKKPNQELQCKLMNTKIKLLILEITFICKSQISSILSLCQFKHEDFER